MGMIRGMKSTSLIVVLSVIIGVLLVAPVSATLVTHSRNLDLGYVDNLKETVGSLNWGGYVAATNFNTPSAAVTAVNASWIVQTAARSNTPSYSSQWTGIGGFFTSDSSLIQLGTESDYYGNSGSYSAWIERLPNSEQTIPLTIKPGDVIVANISLTSETNYWLMTMTDVTSKKSYNTVVNYGSSQLSAEYIEERPELCNSRSCSLTTLSNFGTAYYGSDYTHQPLTEYPTINGQFSALGSSAWQNENIVMFANNGVKEIAAPSSLSSDGTSFMMTYLSGTSGVKFGIPKFGPERWGFDRNSGNGPLNPFDH